MQMPFLALPPLSPSLSQIVRFNYAPNFILLPHCRHKKQHAKCKCTCKLKINIKLSARLKGDHKFAHCLRLRWL